MNVTDAQVTALIQMTEAVNAGDAHGYAAVYAEDARIVILGGNVLEGRKAIEQYEIELLRQFPGVRLALYSHWQKGDEAVVHYGVTAPVPGGRTMGHEGLLFYRFHGSGLIAEERRYNDSLTPMAQMGMLGPTRPRSVPILPAETAVHQARSTPEEERNSGLVRAMLEAIDSADEAAFLSRLADDVVIDELILPDPFVGKSAARDWFMMWTCAASEAATTITTMMGAGDFVLLETTSDFKLKGSLGPVAPSNGSVSVHRAGIFQMKDERLVRASFFMNGRELAEAAGQWPL